MPKICVICGEDCSNRPRTKDARGRYYCMACYEQQRQKQQAVQAPAPVEPATTEKTKRQLPLGFLLSPRIGLFVLGLALIGSYLFGDGILFIFALFIALGIINGYLIGAAKIGALLGGLIAGTLVGIPAGKAMEGIFAGLLGSGGLLNRAISIGICSLLVFLLVTTALQVLIKRKLKKAERWKPYDRLVGAGLGLVEGVFLVCLAVWALLALEPLAAISLAQTGEAKANPVSTWIVSSAQKTHDSAIGDLVDSTNPLSQSEFLTMLSDSMTVVNDPVTREKFLKHPAMKRVEDRPSVQEALKMLREDKQLCDTLENGETADILKAILTSQTLLRVLDETDIVTDLAPLSEEIQQAIQESKQQKSL